MQIWSESTPANLLFQSLVHWLNTIFFALFLNNLHKFTTTTLWISVFHLFSCIYFRSAHQSNLRPDSFLMNHNHFRLHVAFTVFSKLDRTGILSCNVIIPYAKKMCSRIRASNPWPCLYATHVTRFTSSFLSVIMKPITLQDANLTSWYSLSLTLSFHPWISLSSTYQTPCQVKISSWTA